MMKRVIKRSFSIAKSSYLCGTGNRPLLYKTISQQLRETTENYPEHFAVYSEHEKTRLTYTEFYERSRQMASGLLSLDLKEPRKARIGVFAPNVTDYYVA